MPAHSPVAELVVCPPVHEYVNGAVPPDGDEMATPLHRPAHETLLLMVALADRIEGPVRLTTWVLEHDLLSCEINVYVPAHNELMFDAV